jgi:DNA-binding XRE family transcriptional regulator
MSWDKRFKNLKKEMGYTNEDIANIIGLNKASVNNQTQPNAKFPSWLKLSVVIHEVMKEKAENTIPEKQLNFIKEGVREEIKKALLSKKLKQILD